MSRITAHVLARAMAEPTGHDFAAGDRVSFYTNRGLVLATGTVTAVWTEGRTDVARVDVDPNPFVISSIPHVVDVADLTLVGDAP